MAMASLRVAGLIGLSAAIAALNPNFLRTSNLINIVRQASYQIILSIGMTLESRAIQYYSGAAKAARDQEVKSFYEFLADWEKRHFEALKNLHDSVRQDFWAEGGFSPF